MIDVVLSDLTKVDGIVGSLIVGKDGLLIANALPKSMDGDMIGAMSAAIFGTGEKSAERTGQGKLTQAMIEAENGKILVLDVGKAILAVITDRDVNIGLIRLEMNDAKEKLESML
ncbi:MAG: roadblock/LC7 domain-containing protein [Candidatus Hydrothermarchaeota archaeon]